MTEDAELLRCFAVEHSETAFTELIRRHVDLVYSAALRLVNGDAHLAQDVAQQVFAEFARQATRLLQHPAPVGWLYTTTRRAALRAIRTEQRRNTREQEATTMNELLRETTAEPDWDRLRPVLEDAMHKLGEKDRCAVLLRFFQNKSLKEVGMALGLGENAARMRVERALEKLRGILSKRGITTATALASVISANAIQIAPVGLTAALTTISFAAVGSGTSVLLKIMTATQLKFTLGTLAIAGVATMLVQRHIQNRLQQENDSLRRQMLQFQADTADFSNRLTSAVAARALSGEQFDELLRLRGEIGSLKGELAEAVGAEARLKARSNQASESPVPHDEQKQMAVRKMVGAKNLVAAVWYGYAEHHQNQFPTNWDQIGSYFDQAERNGLNPGEIVPDTAADFAEVTNEFDLVYQKPITNLYGSTNFGDIIVVREKQPWQSAEGNWVKAYGFADGHSVIRREPSEGFAVWESQHMASPPANQ